MDIKIKKLSKESIIPSYTQPGDAGMDITAISEKVVEEKEFGYIEYGTGLAFEVPEGYYMDIRPRSSISNTGMFLCNSPGTLDSNYRGELKVRFKWIKDTKKYNIGDRIAQILILPYPKINFIEVEELSETERGESGFGSTGN
jgi:dUTP pyrophosphatase